MPYHRVYRGVQAIHNPELAQHLFKAGTIVTTVMLFPSCYMSSPKGARKVCGKLYNLFIAIIYDWASII